MRYYPLTAPQQNIWDLHKYYENTSICNISGKITLKCDLASDVTEAIDYAVNKLIKSADALRIRLVILNGKVNQYFSEYVYEKIPILDFTDFSDFEIKIKLDEEVKRPFELIDNPLYRFFIIKEGDSFSVFMVIHHLICDGWSTALIANYISECVNEFENNTKDSPALYSYEDFIIDQNNYLQSRRFEKDENYWEEFSGGFEDISYIKPNIPKERNVTAERYVHMIPYEESKRIFDYCSEKEISPDSLYKTAFAIYLHRINHKKNVVLGTPVFNRDGATARQTIGMYVSTMPLSLYVDETLSVYKLLENCIDDSIGMFKHCKYPLRKIQSKVQNYNDNVSQLFDVMISYEESLISGENIDSINWIYQGYCENTLAIHIDDRDGDNCLEAVFDYQNSVFRNASEVKLLAKRIQYIIKQIMDDESRLVSHIDIIPTEEYNRIINEFNDTYSEYPRNKCIHELFTEQVYKTPEKTAIVCDERKLTYLELEHMSNNLAAKMNLNMGEVVALHMNRSEMILVVQLAVLKSGGLFLPIDMTVPTERMRDMLEDCSARYIVVGRDTCNTGFSNSIEVINLDEIVLDRVDSKAILVKVSPEMGAHIIYTSGSTGKPKGSILTHRGLMNFVYHNLVIDPDKCEYDNSISINTISFDMFLCETITPLVVGITVHIATEKHQINQELFAQYVKDNDIQILQTTPTRYKILTADKTNLDYLRNFKAMLLSGEPFSEDIYHEMRQHSDAKIYNTCGPSENHIWICGCELFNDDITLGTPIKNNKIYILNENLSVMPIGVPGEICVSGDCIGLGYLNRPELNKEKYIPHPFDDNQLLYKTGDLGMLRVDGVIEPLGRIDSQVKIRGLRVELGEIESCILSNTNVSNVAVVVIEYKDKSFLSAFYQAEYKLDELAIKEVLSKTLPNYMIPNIFIHLEDFPMTSSGKISRRHLEKYDITPHIKTDEYRPPMTELECELCDAFKNLLKIEEAVGINFNFFDAGGNSIHVIELLSHLPERYNLTAKDIYDYPTPEKLAEYIEKQAVRKYESLSCFHQGNGRQVIICFPFAGSDDSAFIDLAAAIEKKNSVANIYALRYASCIDTTFEKNLEEIEEVIKNADDAIFYSHCAGSAMALKVYQCLKNKRRIKHIIMGANVPPRWVEYYGRAINPWKGIPDKMLLSILNKAGMEFKGMADESKSKLIKHFRNDTNWYFSEMAQLKKPVDVPCTVVVSDADTFTRRIDSVQKAWEKYFVKPIDLIVLNGANHYFHKQRANELSNIICDVIDNK